ncbi:MAG: hypothetical protein HUU20_27325, partial [Pirellulales bacterium]|nr:hypothetical protein [Pirellulales bacterium]
MRTATLNGTLCVLLMTVAVATARAAPDPALVGWWRLDAGQGTAIRDLSGNGNDGTVVGARWRKAARGSELFFDGAGDYVDCGQSPALAGLTDDFSVLAWVKLDGGATEVSNFYVAENETYHQNGFMMRVDGALGKLTIRGSSKGRNGAGFSQRIVPQDRWCMVGMSVHDRQGTMYVDGERDLTHALGE